MSESSAVNPQSLGSSAHDYDLHSDLAKMCLPSQFRDAGHRRLAWVNSICFLFLIVGLVGLKAPRVVTKPLSKVEESVPVVWTPPPEQPKQEEVKTEQPQEDTPTETPQVVTVVAANPAAVTFAVPVQGAVAVAAEVKFATPPPPVNYVAPKPRTFNPDASNEGSFPKPDYPGYALRNHYQGIVNIEIQVDESGTITSAKVQKTSGYSILDEAALRVVKTSWHFKPGPPRWLIWPCIFTLQ